MTSVEEVDRLDRERQDYLIALHELTAGDQLRWSTHREVAARAKIPDERIMSISLHLSREVWAGNRRALYSVAGSDN